MNERVALFVIITLLISSFFCVIVFAQSSVGVEVGHWAEYTGVLKQNGTEDSTTIKIEVTEINTNQITLKQTTIDSDGSTTSETISGELGKDGFSGWLIPANLNVGDTFLENENVLTIIGTEERSCLGENRQIVYADIPQMQGMRVFWDKETGVAVEAIRELETSHANTKLVDTNVWGSNNLGLDTSIVYIVIIVAVLIAALIGVFVFRKKGSKMQ